MLEAYETDEGPGGEVHVFAITGTDMTPRASGTAGGGVWTRSWHDLDEPIADAGLDFMNELETIEPD